jgi:DNA-binding transcriptional regulator YiaG
MLYACVVEDTDRTKAEQSIARALDRMAQLYDEAARTVEAISDPQEAFEVATALAEQVRALHDLQATKLRKLRARQAVRIREKESLSLAALANRISVSKQRADQLVRDAATKVGGKE